MILDIAFSNLILVIFYMPLIMSVMATDSPNASNAAHLLAYTGLTAFLFPIIGSIVLLVTHNYTYLLIVDFIPILVIALIFLYYCITNKKNL